MASILEMELEVAMSRLARAQDYQDRMEMMSPDMAEATANAVRCWRRWELSRAAKREADRIASLLPYVISEIGR
jgi:hypothetical protein